MNHVTILPHELIRSIISHLPIDKHLRSVALSSKLLFSETILNDLTFARLHVQSLIPRPSLTLWEYLDDNGIKYNEWKSLPFNYKCAVYSLILAEPTWHLNAQIGLSDANLMYHERWRVPEEVSLRIIKTLVGVMDVTSQKDRALRVAVMLGYTSTVEFLLSIEKVDPRADNDYCIITAIINNSTDIVRLLVNCDKVDLSHGGYEPFLVACQQSNVEIIKILLASDKVDPCVGDSFCVSVACWNEASVDVLRVLLEDGRVNPAANNNRAFLMALNRNKEFAAFLLTDPRVDPSIRNNMAIPAVARHGWTDLLELLLKHERVDPAQVGSEAIIEALHGESMDCVRLLVGDLRVDPSQNNNEALLTAVRSQNKEAVGLLLKDSRVKTMETLENAVGIAENMSDMDMVVFLSRMIEELDQKEMWDKLRSSGLE